MVTIALRVAKTTPGKMAFEWDATLGRTYQPQGSANQLATDWFDLGGAFVATNNNLSSVTNATRDGGLRFSRLRVQGTLANTI